MNRQWVLFHLREAAEGLSRTIQEIEADHGYDHAEYWPAMQHVYHHLNTAWNARDASPADVANETDDMFNEWSRFPPDLPMMGVEKK